MPRKSLAARLTPTPAPQTPAPGLQPPEGMGAAEADLFRRTVKSLAPGHLQACDVPDLCRWCEAATEAEKAARHIREHGAVIGGAQSPYLRVMDRASRLQKMWSVRLRFGPQGRDSPQTLGRRQQAHRPSIYDSIPTPPNTGGSHPWPK